MYYCINKQTGRKKDKKPVNKNKQNVINLHDKAPTPMIPLTGCTPKWPSSSRHERKVANQKNKKKKEIAAKKHYISRWLHMHYLYSFLVYAN